MGWAFPRVLTRYGTVKEAYGVYRLPMTYFIDTKRFINHVHAGVVAEALLMHELEKIR